MKIRHTNHIELSVSNLRALLKDIERKEREGRTVSTVLHRQHEGMFLAVSVVADADHYTAEELAARGNDWNGAVNA